jgi:hypothetical protein
MRRAWITGIFGIAVVGVCLGARLGDLAHLALVTHVPCAEHGEPVHDGGDGEDHGHCLLAAPSGPADAPAPPAARAASAAPAGAVLPVRRAPPPAPIALVHLAPKHSPPA